MSGEFDEYDDDEVQSGKEVFVGLKTFLRIDTMGALTAANENEANLSRAVYISYHPGSLRMMAKLLRAKCVVHLVMAGRTV
jgi:hypothetical protein